MTIYFKLYKYKCLELNVIFKAVKMNFGSKLWVWVSYHTTILQS